MVVEVIDHKIERRNEVHPWRMDAALFTSSSVALLYMIFYCAM
jgi:hypothetical protein